MDLGHLGLLLDTHMQQQRYWIHRSVPSHPENPNSFPLAFGHTCQVYTSPHPTFSCFQFSSVTQSCPTLCDPMNRSRPGLPLHHQLPSPPKPMTIESVMPSNHLILCRPLLLLPSIFPSIFFNLSQDLFKSVSSLHQVSKVLEFQLQHQSFQRTPRTDIL